jgi:biopolymer transport protein ExbB
MIKMKYILTAFILTCLLTGPGIVGAQPAVTKDPTRRQRIMAKLAKIQAEQKEAEKGPGSAENAANAKSSFGVVAGTVAQQLQESLTELNKLRETIAQGKIPLSRKLSDLESELIKTRLDYQQTSRLLDSRTLDLSNLRNEIKSREEEASYISNLLGEYIRNLESRLHIAEIQRYREALEAAKLAPENSNFSKQEVYQAQTALVTLSLKRLEEALGGSIFKGTAVVASGLVKPGTFVLLGPAALFRSEDGQSVGTAEQRLGALEPAVIAFGDADDAQAAEQIITSSRGNFPLDPTLGSAHKIEATQETIWEHIKKGGPVMVPILGLAGAAFLVAFYKWMSMLFLRNPSPEQIKKLLNAVSRYDREAATREANKMGGPVGKMLVAGIEHLEEPHELIEEIMYEIVLSARLKLQGLLPFIAITAASSPLLGLLGTVTGIINTFKLITVFGSGDVKTLSSGISEALITTEFGLIVAIPSLLLHAFLSRKTRGVIDQMEKAAVAFINQISKTEYRALNSAAKSNVMAGIARTE